MFTRLCIVAQLVLCLSLLFFQLFKSFSESYFATHHTLAIYQNIFADESLLNRLQQAGLQSEHAKVLRHRQRFERLPAFEKQPLLQAYQKLLTPMPYSTFFKQSLSRFFFELPTLIMGYLCLSLASCILYLYRIQGSTLAMTLLPITLGAYLVLLSPSSLSKPSSPYPTEEELLHSYSPSPALPSEQRLVLAWQAYLIDVWAPQPFQGFDQGNFPELSEEGEFYFQLHRLQQAAKAPPFLRASKVWYFHPPFLRVLFIWNLFLALWLTSRELRAKG